MALRLLFGRPNRDMPVLSISTWITGVLTTAPAEHLL